MKLRIALSIAVGALALTPAAFAAPAAKKAVKPAAEAAQPAGRVVEYADLEHRIGAVVAVESNLGTVRRGTLVKYTNPGLTLQLGPEAGSVPYSVPRETVRKITIITEAPAAQETGSAKKN